MWARVTRILSAAAERPAKERVAFVHGEAAGDPALRDEVLALLTAHDEAGRFLETPAAATALPHVVPGDRLGPYEIVALVGAGGMGEVYRARDGRLGREVAVKVLPGDLAADADRLRRFEDEARAASALNHPHILAVYDVGRHGNLPYLVTELLEGRTLADRIAQGPVPLREALEWGAQAARALAAAHERGIVHRDLKPSNLFVTAGGALKLLDFGLAKLAASPDAAVAGRPGPRRSGAGGPIGTVGYMSPEQVRGDAVDFRSDQFSLGCLLYELLSGREPFPGPTPEQALAAVLATEPPPLGRGAPRTVSWIVERCLAKDPDDRYGSTRDLARDLELALGRLSELTLPEPGAPPRRRRAPLLAAGLAVLVAAFAAARWLRPGPGEREVPVVRYLTYSGHESFPAASPDGKTIAFTSTRDGLRRIWLKQLATGAEVPLTAGEDDFARFSPDGAQVLFARVAAGRSSLFRVASLGGEPRKVVDDALYGDFAPDGRRVAFVRATGAGDAAASMVGTVGVDGGGEREIARLPAATFLGSAFAHPRFSPDGARLAGTQSTAQLGEPTAVVILEMATGRVRRLVPSEAGVWRGGIAWTGPSSLVCAQPESVVGQQTGNGSRIVSLDVPSGRARALLWSPVSLNRLDRLGGARLVLETGSLRQSLRELSLGPGAPAPDRWMTHGNSADRQPVYAPDGEWIAFSSNRSGNLDLWAVSRRTGAVRRLTDDPAQDSDPGFMPDGRLLFSSNRGGRFEVWIAAADGSGPRQVTSDGVDAENPVATPDGQWIVYASANPRSRGLMKVRPDGRDAALVVAGNVIEPEVSPDGVHVAFLEDHGTPRAALRVARLADGARVAFEIAFPHPDATRSVDQGRSRWMPGGGAIAFIARESERGYAVFTQAFTPGPGTRAARRRLGSGDPDLVAESLGVSPDGGLITISYRQQASDLMLADGIADLGR
jgi:eukaryotic-like serine/threonine-protein kinase